MTALEEAAIAAGKTRDALVIAATHLAAEVRADVTDERVSDALVVLVMCAEAHGDAEQELTRQLALEPPS